MKKVIIAASPVVLLLWILIAIEEGVVASTIDMVVALVFAAFIIVWLTFVKNHFNDD